MPVFDIILFLHNCYGVDWTVSLWIARYARRCRWYGDVSTTYSRLYKVLDMYSLMVCVGAHLSSLAWGWYPAKTSSTSPHDHVFIRIGKTVWKYIFSLFAVGKLAVYVLLRCFRGSMRSRHKGSHSSRHCHGDTTFTMGTEGSLLFKEVKGP